jgi:hypothetical protein
MRERQVLSVLAVTFVLVCVSLAHAGEEAVVLSTPEIGWAMKVKAPGFVLDQKHVEPGGNAYFMASDRGRRLIISGRIEKVNKVGTAKEVRKYFWEEIKKTAFKMDDIKMSEPGQMATVEYLIREHQGIPLNQKNLWAFFAKGQYWMNLHLSEVDFQPGDEALFKRILQSVSLEEKMAGKRVETTYRVNDEQAIGLEVPEKWLDEIQRSKDVPPTIILKPDTLPAMAVHLTPMWNPGREKDFNSPERIRKILKDAGTGLLSEAQEKELRFQELKGKTGVGYYFSITDKAPSVKAGEFKYMTQGGIPVGSLLVMFTIFSNEKDSVGVTVAREIIANATQK